MAQNEPENPLQLEMIGCFKALMNNAYVLLLPTVQHEILTYSRLGMDSVLADSDHIEHLAGCITLHNFDQTKQILEMLSVICWYSERGHEIVLQAMDTYRRSHRERYRYQTVVKAIEGGPDLEIKAVCLTFINTLISASTQLDHRVSIRNDFIALDVLVICHAIENQYLSSENNYNGPGAQDFNKQIKVFEGMMHADHEDTISMELDLSNLDNVIQAIRENCHQAGFQHHFLHVLHALLVVPTEISLGTKVWELVEEILLQVTSLNHYDDISAKKIDFTLLKQLRSDVSSVEDKFAQCQTLEDIVQRQKAKIVELEKACTEFEVKNDTKTEVIVEKTFTDQDMKREHDKLTNSNLRLKQEVLQMKNILAQHKIKGYKFEPIVMNSSQRSECATQTDAPSQKMESPSASLIASPQPPPPPRSTLPEYEKFFKLKKMGMPLEQIKMKIQLEGLDPSILDDAPPPPPPAEPAPVEESRPEYVKFFKLKKMGMPIEQVKMKMQLEGLDPSVLDVSPVSAPVPAEAPSDPRASQAEYQKFFKLKKMGMPLEQVKMKMQMEGLDPSVLDSASEFAPSSAPAPVPAPSDPRAAQPEYQKFFKLKKMGMPLEQVKMKMQMEGLDPSVLDSTSVSAPSPVPVAAAPSDPRAAQPEYQKFFKLKKMGMPLEQVKMKMQMEGLDPSVLDCTQVQSQSASVPVSHPIAKLPVPPPKPAAVVDVGPKMPMKTKIKPNVKMRGLFWSKLDDTVVHDSIWAKLDDSKVALDLSSLEQEFGRDESKDTSSKTSIESKQPSKPKVVQLVDPKRQQNCSIALARFRMPFHDIKTAILDMDETVLNLERTQILLSLAPTAEELEAVTSFDGDVNLLGNTEKFIQQVSEIPRLTNRLKSIITAQSFEQRHIELEKKLDLLIAATKEACQCTDFFKILEIILAIGNYMNGSTSRGGAWGFQLDVLPKLLQVKAAANKNRTLMHFIVDTIQRIGPKDFYSGLSHFEQASGMSLSQLETEFRSHKSSIVAVRRELEQSQSSQKFVKRMKSFLQQAETQVEKFQTKLDRLTREFSKMTSQYGINTKKPSDEDHAQRFFRLWHEFILNYKKAVLENEQFRQKQLAALTPPAVVDAKEDDTNLFSQFSKSQQGDASEIVAKFRNRTRKPAQQRMGFDVTNELVEKLAKRRTSATLRRKNGE